MANITKQSLPKVRYLITQSILGNHLLFAPEHIREAMRISSHESIDTRTAKHIDRCVEQLLNTQSIDEGRALLASLPLPIYRLVLRAYLNIVDQTLARSGPLKH